MQVEVMRIGRKAHAFAHKNDLKSVRTLPVLRQQRATPQTDETKSSLHDHHVRHLVTGHAFGSRLVERSPLSQRS
jgi:hypothetical protein